MATCNLKDVGGNAFGLTICDLIQNWRMMSDDGLQTVLSTAEAMMVAGKSYRRRHNGYYSRAAKGTIGDSDFELNDAVANWHKLPAVIQLRILNEIQLELAALELTGFSPYSSHGQPN